MIFRIGTTLAEHMLRLRSRFGGSPALRERLVIGAMPVPADIWIHGASVGELNSARAIIQSLAQEHTLIVTCNSETGRDTVRGWGLSCRLAPLDLPGALDRFLSHARPRLQITLEGEFWPLRSRKLAEQAIPQAMIGARMSAKSAATWARLPRVIRPMLTRIAALSAQDASSEARLRELGLRDEAVLPRLDLKLLDPARVTPVAETPLRAQTILAASTHEGEEAVILDGWQSAAEVFPDLRLILAIRHPNRGDEVARLLRDRGLDFARRSEGAEGATVLLADTLGEMSRWYDAAGLCIVGGSFTDRGGHTPWEPAAHRCAILHGPHVSNFTDSFATLGAAGAALPVEGPDLGATLIRILEDPAAMQVMGGHARAVLTERAGDPAQLLERLRDLAQTPASHDI